MAEDKNVGAAMLGAGDAQEAPKTKRPKKLSKGIEGKVVTITEGITGKVMTFDFSKLPQTIQDNLGPFGLGHKLGDAAAGSSGEEAVKAIETVWNGLMAGNWSVRAPKEEKVSKSDLLALYEQMGAAEKKVFKPTLIKLGILKEEGK